VRVFSALGSAGDAFCYGASQDLTHDVAPVRDGCAIKCEAVYNGVVPPSSFFPDKNEKIRGGLRKPPLASLGADKSVRKVVLATRNLKKGEAVQAMDPSADP
jgi:hypothetical protein